MDAVTDDTIWLKTLARLVARCPVPYVKVLDGAPEPLPLRGRGGDARLLQGAVALAKAFVDDLLAVPPGAVGRSAEAAVIDLQCGRCIGLPTLGQRLSFSITTSASGEAQLPQVATSVHPLRSNEG